MTVRPLRLGTHGYSWVVLTISIKAVFLPVLCPALLRFVASRRLSGLLLSENAASAANIRISGPQLPRLRAASPFFYVPPSCLPLSSTVVVPVGSERLAMISGGTGWAWIAPGRSG